MQLRSSWPIGLEVLRVPEVLGSISGLAQNLYHKRPHDETVVVNL